MKKYKVTDTGVDNLYTMEDNPTEKQVSQVLTDIRKRLRENPDKNFLVISCWAGHGMQLQGKQIVLINEFSPKSRFYKHCKVEDEARAIAKNYKNSY